MVLVLGVGGLSLPHGEVMIALTFGVVLASNLIQGLTMPGVVRRIGLTAQRVIPAAGVRDDD